MVAGSGTGKSTFCKEVIHHLLMCDQKVGVLALEESNKRTLLGLRIHMNKNLLVDRNQATDDEVLEAFDELFTDRTASCLMRLGLTTSTSSANASNTWCVH